MTYTNKIALITGASGFLGVHLAEVCSKSGYKVVGVDRNMVPACIEFLDYIHAPINDVDWDCLLDRYRPAICFHLAASASVSASMQDPFGDFTRVLPSTAKILHAIAKKSPKTCFVFYSSAAVYGNPISLPITEESTVKPISPYGVHKHVAEQLIYSVGACYGLNTICLRIFSAFGDGLKKQLFFDLDKKIRTALSQNKKTISMFGTGNESRDFIHGHDVARAALLLAEQKTDEGNVFVNIGSGVEVSISDAVATYLSASKMDINVVFTGESKPGDPQNWCADISKLKEAGFVNNITLPDGLSMYSRWLNKFKCQ